MFSVGQLTSISSDNGLTPNRICQVHSCIYMHVRRVSDESTTLITAWGDKITMMPSVYMEVTCLEVHMLFYWRLNASLDLNRLTWYSRCTLYWYAQHIPDNITGHYYHKQPKHICRFARGRQVALYVLRYHIPIYNCIHTYCFQKHMKFHFNRNLCTNEHLLRNDSKFINTGNKTDVKYK